MCFCSEIASYICAVVLELKQLRILSECDLPEIKGVYSRYTIQLMGEEALFLLCFVFDGLPKWIGILCVSFPFRKGDHTPSFIALSSALSLVVKCGPEML